MHMQVMQQSLLHSIRTKWETVQFALPTWNPFTQENESTVWSQLSESNNARLLHDLHVHSHDYCDIRQTVDSTLGSSRPRTIHTKHISRYNIGI